MRASSIFEQLISPVLPARRTTEILSYNPTTETTKKDPAESKVYIYHYNNATIEHCKVKALEELKFYAQSDKIIWINIDGVSKEKADLLSSYFHIHPLLTEDILSTGQRPKFDEIDGVIFCLLNMLYWNDQRCVVEQEQISVVVGRHFVITFQEDAEKDVFDSIRDKLLQNNSKIRQRRADYLCYSLLDVIVDHYFEVTEKLGEKIEGLEEEVIRVPTKRTLAKLNALKKELIVLRRNVSPVRDMLNSMIKSESDLLDDQIHKYLKDVYDHIVQANDVVETYRDLLNGMQDLYISQVNLKLNEAMKVMTIVTCLMAPATVIGGIFGMNFEVIPIAHQKYGFYIAMAFMLIIPLIMLRIFKKRGWF